MKSKKSVKRKRQLVFSLMALPAVLYIFINNYIPMAGLSIAFKDINYSRGIFGSDWIGLKNFKFLFSTSDAWVITRNTIVYNLIFIFTNVVIAVIVAYLLSRVRNKLASRFYQSTLLLPHLFSMVVIAFMAFGFLSGDKGFINNYILGPLGLNDIAFYSEGKYWYIILPIVSAWKNLGYYCIIYYATILGIDDTLYESAALEGATGFQMFTKITVPLLKPTIITMTILQLGKIFNSDFGLFYQVPMNSSAILPQTNVISTYVYRALLETGDIGMSSAACLYQAVAGFCLVMLSNLVIRKASPDDAMF